MKTGRIIAISQRVDCYPERQEVRDALDQNLCLWIETLGGLPVPIPNSLGKSKTSFDAWLKAMSPDAIVLSGGNDIGKVIERDATERMLIDYAEQHKRPLLGICRGMQMLGVWAGVPLKDVQGHVAVRHSLKGHLEGSVNSYHNQSLTRCPDRFIETAASEDGEIEAIKHQTLPWEGWMWHPEREAPFNEADLKRAKSLLINEGF